MASEQAMKDPLRVGKAIRAQLAHDVPTDVPLLLDFREGTDRTITDEVVRLTDELCADARRRTLANALTRHLHAFAREVTPTHAEWASTIDWLTRAGKESTDFKNEFILLSDCLGLSVLIDELNHPRPAGATDSCEEGPFFTTDSADVPSGGDLAAPGTVGEKLVFEGTIKNLQGEPVKGATAEVWQADGDGLYDIQYPDRAGPNDRGRVHARADGTLSFRGVLPTAYPIPADGPIGEFLRALGRHPHRAAHLHFRLAAPGYDELTTALYPAHSPFLGSDPVWATKRSLITDVEPVTDAGRIAAFGFGADTPRVFLWKYDFVLATEAEVAALKQKTLHPTVLAGQTKAQ